MEINPVLVAEGSVRSGSIKACGKTSLSGVVKGSNSPQREADSTIQSVEAAMVVAFV